MGKAALQRASLTVKQGIEEERVGPRRLQGRVHRLALVQPADDHDFLPDFAAEIGCEFLHLVDGGHDLAVLEPSGVEGRQLGDQASISAQ